MERIIGLYNVSIRRNSMRTSNPALTPATFNGYQSAVPRGEAMTIGGAINRTAMLLLLVLLSAGYTWNLFLKSGNPAVVTPWMMGGVIAGLITAIVTVVKKEWSPITAPLYAIFEGLFLGGLSSMMEASYPGIVIQAVGATFATLGVMLFLYKTGIIKPTEKFIFGVVAATGAVAVVYLVTWVLSFFGVSTNVLFGNGVIGIGFSIVVAGIAALNLILDFAIIEQGAQRGMPRYMEWYGAFALMVTLIWLYLELLRLIGNLRSR